jgi:multiple antibiotic resistance protein
MDSFTRSFLLLFVLLNPFIMSVYVLDLVKALPFRAFASQLGKAGAISFAVFVVFAWAGETVFEDVLQVRFFAFLIFGGITFVIIGIRMVGQAAPRPLLSRDHEAAASIAMPYIVGPGTISASVLTGARLQFVGAVVAIALALGLAVVAILAFKRAHDVVRARSEPLVQRYTEVAGRVTGLFTGSFGVDMVLRGVEGWLNLSALLGR